MSLKSQRAASVAGHDVRHLRWLRKTIGDNLLDDRALAGLKIRKGLRDWQRLGVRRPDGRDLPARNLRSSILQLGGAGGSAYVVYDNFHAILRWNRSNLFATAVGTLADRIGGR